MEGVTQFRMSYTILDTSQLSECHISVKLTHFPHFYIAQIGLVLYCKLEIRKASSLEVAVSGMESFLLFLCHPSKSTFCHFQLYHTIPCMSLQQNRKVHYAFEMATVMSLRAICCILLIK